MNRVNSSILSYRSEIDGLRAIAVTSVIFYHAQMVIFGRNWFEGGFIGVDIFFVISGYLITRIILSELKAKGSINFLNFYERRVRRILPMLFVVIFFSVGYGLFKLVPNEIRELSISSLFSIFFASNIYFSGITTEYGAESSLLMPMLHTWSLGIEEQFYLIFPILSLVIFKLFRPYFLIILFSLSLLSLQFSELMLVKNSDLNFYLPLSRFWELAAGSMLAYRELNHKVLALDKSIFKRVFPILGLSLIVFSISFFDGKTPHPGYYTLIPIIGVALVIVFSSKDEFVGRLLSSKPFVWVGFISYSAYLWHFPIFAFARIDNKLITNYDKFEIIIATLFISIVGYHLIEKPFRKKSGSTCVLIILSSMFLVLLVVLSYMSFSSKFEKYWLNYSSSEKANAYFLIRDTQSKTPLIDKKCIFNVVEKPDYNLDIRVNNCRSKNDKAIFIIGDSHAINLFNIFGYSHRFPVIVGMTQGGCRLHGCGKNENNQYEFFIESVLPLIRSKDIIIFHQSGSYLVADRKGSNDSHRTFNEGVFSIDHENIKRVQMFLNYVSGNTKAKVYWLGPFLEYRYNPKSIVRDVRKNGLIDEKYLSVNPNSPIVFNELEKVLI